MNGLGLVPATMVACPLDRLMATWNSRRSSSTSSARRWEYWSASANVTHNFEQDRVSENEGESVTPSSTVVGASVGYRFFTSGTVHRVELVGSNLTDEVIRVATSFLKDSIVMPGRNLTLNYRLSF